jgi:hypothetical protein
MRGAHLIGIKHRDQRTRRNRKPLHGGTVKHN